MKKIIVATALSLAVICVQAQSKNQNNANKGGKPESTTQTEKTDKGNKGGKRPDANTRATKLTNRMEKMLQLNSDQKPKVLEINLANAKKMDLLFVKKGNEKKGLGKEGQAIAKERDTELKSVLTTEQYAQWTKIKEERKAKMKEKRKTQEKNGKLHKDGANGKKDGDTKDYNTQSMDDVNDADVTEEIESEN
jgi:periplasmic protein CpxP/Spy